MILPDEEALLGSPADRRDEEAALIIGALVAETALLDARARSSYARGLERGRADAERGVRPWLLLASALGLGVGWTLAALVLLP